MKFNKVSLENQAEDAIRIGLQRIPFIKIRNVQRNVFKDGKEIDIILTLKLSGKEKKIIVEVKGKGEPRIARNAINHLLLAINVFSGSYGIFMAPYISPQAAAICTQAGIGYLDFSGNCLISFEQAYIEMSGCPNIYARKRDLRSLYSPKASRLLRVLLNNPKRVWKIKDLAKEAEVSFGQVSNVKKLLADREWLVSDSDGIVLKQPQEVLVEWAENYDFRKSLVSDYYSLEDSVTIEEKLAMVCRKQDLAYALTGISGAARLAPAVRSPRIMAYVSTITKEILTGLGIKEVSSGANVTLLIPYDEGVYYGMKEIRGINIVSPVQLYLDLKSYKGRGEEAAQVLLERIIQPSW